YTKTRNLKGPCEVTPVSTNEESSESLLGSKLPA
ncbi:unnamed protein product, partial [Allacma fusca]